MKLFELTGIKNYKDMPGNLIMKMLDRIGFFKDTLGRGSFGYAFEISNGDVLKVWHRDEAYEKFIEYCIANKSNPYLLKVKGKVQSFEIRHAANRKPIDMKFVRIEKVNPLKSLKPLGYDDKDSSKTLDEFFWQFQKLIYKRNFDLLEKADTEMYETLYLKKQRGSPEFEKILRDIAELMKTFQEMGLKTDVHSGNFGLRGNQLVLIDPVLTYQDEKTVPIDDVLQAF